VSLIVIIWTFIMIIALPQQRCIERLLCLMTLAFFLGVDMIPLTRLASSVDPTWVYIH